MIESFQNTDTNGKENLQVSSIQNQILEKQIEERRAANNKQSLLGLAISSLDPASHKSLAELQSLRAQKDTNSEDQIKSALTRDKAHASFDNNLIKYGSEFLKAAPLFMGGRLGTCLTASVYSLDQINPHSSAKHQTVEALLGASKGLMLKTSFDMIGSTNWGCFTKGASLGLSSSLIEQGLSRQTYTSNNGDFNRSTFLNGLMNIGSNIIDPKQIALDAAAFGAGSLACKLAGKVALPALSQSVLATNMTTGFIFGTTSNLSTELMSAGRHKEINASHLILDSLASGAVNSLAAAPAAMHFHASNSPGQHCAEQPAPKAPEVAKVPERHELHDSYNNEQSREITTQNWFRNLDTEVLLCGASDDEHHAPERDEAESRHKKHARHDETDVADQKVRTTFEKQICLDNPFLSTFGPYKIGSIVHHGSESELGQIVGFDNDTIVVCYPKQIRQPQNQFQINKTDVRPLESTFLNLYRTADGQIVTIQPHHDHADTVLCSTHDDLRTYNVGTPEIEPLKIRSEQFKEGDRVVLEPAKEIHSVDKLEGDFAIIKLTQPSMHRIRRFVDTLARYTHVKIGGSMNHVMDSTGTIFQLEPLDNGSFELKSRDDYLAVQKNHLRHANIDELYNRMVRTNSEYLNLFKEWHDISVAKSLVAAQNENASAYNNQLMTLSSAHKIEPSEAMEDLHLEGVTFEYDRLGNRILRDTDSVIFQAITSRNIWRGYNYDGQSQLSAINFGLGGFAERLPDGVTWQHHNEHVVVPWFTGNISVTSSGTLKYTAQNGQSIVEGFDGTEAVDDGTGRITYRVSNFSVQKENLERARDSWQQKKQIDRFTEMMNKFEERCNARGLDKNEQAKTYFQINRLLNSDSLAIDKNRRDQLAQQILFNCTLPKLIYQGLNGRSSTCVQAALENRMYTKIPSEAARLVADVAIDGKYVSAGRIERENADRFKRIAVHTVDYTPLSHLLAPDRDARWFPLTVERGTQDIYINGKRNFASQLFQETALNLTVAQSSPLPMNSVKFYDRHPDHNGPEMISSYKFNEDGTFTRSEITPFKGTPIFLVPDIYSEISESFDRGFTIMGAYKLDSLSVPNSEMPVEARPREDASSIVQIKTQSELCNQLRALKEREQLPAIILVMGVHSLYDNRPRDNTKHAMCVVDISENGGDNPAVEITNQSFAEENTVVPLEKIFKIMMPRAAS